MKEVHRSGKSPQENRHSVREYVVSVFAAGKTLARGVVEFLPHSIETRIAEKDLAERERQEYKIALLKPYMDKLPINVIRVM